MPSKYPERGKSDGEDAGTEGTIRKSRVSGPFCVQKGVREVQKDGYLSVSKVARGGPKPATSRSMAKGPGKGITVLGRSR